MNIYCKTLTGKTGIIDANLEDTISQIKSKIDSTFREEAEDDYHITVAGKQPLNDKETLKHFLTRIQNSDLDWRLDLLVKSISSDIYEELPHRFKQYLSAVTQNIRNDRGKISTKKYWNSLREDQKNVLRSGYTERRRNDPVK